MIDSQITVTDTTTLVNDDKVGTDGSIFNDCWTRWNSYSLILWLQILFSFIFSSIQLSNDEYSNTYEDESYDRQLLSSCFFLIIAVVLIFIEFVRQKQLKKQQNLRLRQIACFCLVIGGLLRFVMIQNEISNVCNPINSNSDQKNHCKISVYGIRLIYVFFPILYGIDLLKCVYNNIELRVFINSMMIFIGLLLYSIGQFYFKGPTWVKTEEERVGRTGLLFILFACFILCVYSFMLRTKHYMLANINQYSNLLVMLRYLVFVLLFVGVPFAYFAWIDIHPSYSLNAYQGPNTVWVGLTIMLAVDALSLNA